MAAEDKKIPKYCPRCNRTKKLADFYASRNLEKYPDGHLDKCKECITAHVNNFDPDTYLWILQEADVPFIPDQWNQLLKSYCKDKSKVTGMTVIGRYLGKMMLSQYKDWRWKDSKYLQEVEANKTKTAMQAQGFDAQAIDQAIQAQCFPIPENAVQPAEPAPMQFDAAKSAITQNPFQEQNDYFDQVNGIEEDTTIADSLTDEDKLMLRMKWGKSYRPDEWVWLENLYNEMKESYDIQTAGHEDTLKLVCKTSLKSNQLLDMGDVDGANKMIRMYDTLMKSGKFTANQNKAESGEAVDSISEIVLMCERDGFIPRYYTDGPQDKVDRTLQDFQRYVKTLISEDSNLANLIEQAVKNIQADKEKEAIMDADAAGDDDQFEDSLFDENQTYINDDEFSELKDMVEDQQEDDEDFLKSLIDTEDLT